jgi:hypothetical protein
LILTKDCFTDRTPVFEPRLMWGTEHIMHSTAVENCTLGGS